MTDEETEQAEADVQAFLNILERDYGITPETLRWFARYQRSVTRWGDWVAKSIVTTIIGSIVGGVIFILYTGVMHLLTTVSDHVPK